MPVANDVRARLRQHHVAAVWLFGSQVSGRPRPHSDTDVAVLLHEGVATPSLLERGRLSDPLASALDTAEIDLLVLDEASLGLRAAVVRDGRLLVDLDPDRRVQFVVQTQSSGPTCGWLTPTKAELTLPAWPARGWDDRP